MNEELQPTDIVPLPKFLKEMELAGFSPNSIRWHVRFRRENGLLAARAVHEVRNDPRAKRGMLYVNRQRFLQWMTGDLKSKGKAA